jgi:hypothetical protein
MNGNLIPTPVVNKNGVRTTVYKREVGEGASRGKGIPAPSRTTVKRSDREYGVEEKITAECSGSLGNSGFDANLLRHYLRGYSEETLSRLEEAFREPQSDDERTYKHTLSIIMGRGCKEEYLNDLMSFLPNNLRLARPLRSIRYYYELQHLPVGKISEDDETYERVLALVRTTEQARVSLNLMYGDVPVGAALVGITEAPDYECFVFRDERVTKLVLDNPDREHLIRKVIADRSSVDYEVLREALDIGSAMGNGSL